MYTKITSNASLNTHFLTLPNPPIQTRCKQANPHSLPRIRAGPGIIPRRRVPPDDEVRPTTAHGARHTHRRRGRPDALRVVTVRAKIALPDLLPAVVARLVDPGLRGVGEGPAGADPVEVFALVGSLVAGAMVQTVVGGREVVGPGLG